MAGIALVAAGLFRKSFPNRAGHRSGLQARKAWRGALRFSSAGYDARQTDSVAGASASTLERQLE